MPVQASARRSTLNPEHIPHQQTGTDLAAYSKQGQTSPVSVGTDLKRLPLRPHPHIPQFIHNFTDDNHSGHHFKTSLHKTPTIQKKTLQTSVQSVL